MEDNKIRIGITQGDINGVGYEVILKTFSDPTMLELCTPIIYGSPKVAAYHRKALDVQTNFSIINTASEAGCNRLSVVNCTDDSGGGHLSHRGGGAGGGLALSQPAGNLPGGRHDPAEPGMRPASGQPGPRLRQAAHLPGRPGLRGNAAPGRGGAGERGEQSLH